MFGKVLEKCGNMFGKCSKMNGKFWDKRSQLGKFFGKCSWGFWQEKMRGKK